MPHVNSEYRHSGARNGLSERQFHRASYPTVQGYARWLFERFSIGTFVDTPLLTLLPDYEQFRTLDDVNAAWSQALEKAQAAESAHTNTMPVDAIDDDVFMYTRNPLIYSFRRHFTPDELFPQGNAPFATKITPILTVDQKQSIWHICFTEAGGVSVADNLNEIVHLLSREIDQYLQRKTKILQECFSVSANVNSNKPNIYFYIHVPPGLTPSGCESFYRAPVALIQGKIMAIEQKDYDAIPEAVRAGNRNLASPPVDWRPLNS